MKIKLSKIKDVFGFCSCKGIYARIFSKTESRKKNESRITSSVI